MEDQTITFAGRHLLVEIWEAQGLTRLDVVEQALREAVEACGAHLLNISLHHFSPNDGISGVAVISESHISIHTWPEYGYAAVDVFTCGTCDPYLSIPVFKRIFQPRKLQLMEIKRGIF